MDVTLAALTLLHILVLVYWLGGDLGAFYASTILTDTRKSAAARAQAGLILNAVDMAPRTALILAFPTGFTLAVQLGHWSAPTWQVAAAWITCLLWLAIAWSIHLQHAPPKALSRRVDLAIRWAFLLKLAAIAAVPGIVGQDLPLFLRLKLAILAGAIAAGLAIRVILAPFGPPFMALIKGEPTPETDTAIAGILGRARPLVITLWLLLIAAALLGLARPI